MKDFLEKVNKKDNEVIKMEMHDGIYLSMITIKFKNYLVSSITKSI